MKLNKLARVSVVSTMENALKKLKKEKIAAYDCKKEGVRFIFSVKDKDIQKVFAIFEKPCYNIKVEKYSFKNRILNVLKLRAGMVLGAAVFIAACFISNSFILRIEVNGNGGYLAPEVIEIVTSEGADKFGRFSSFNKISATGRILALPQVTFCNIEKCGSVLKVDVRVSGEDGEQTVSEPLYSDVNGTVKRLVAVCGTPAVSAGDEVRAGDALIFPFVQTEEKTAPCLAAGFAEIECKKTAEYFAECDSEENLKNALASLLLEGETVTSEKHAVKPTEGGVIYVIDFTYLHKVSINFG